MNPRRFDALTQSLASATTRRGLLGTLVALGAGLLGARATEAQVQCGNVACKSNPGKCATGCVCCVYGNGNSRCMPPGNCTGKITTPTPTTTTTTTPPPAPTIRMIPVLQGTQCTATFFADFFPAGDYDVTLIHDGGQPQLVNEVTIADGEIVAQVLVYTYLLDPGTSSSITVADGAFSRTFGFAHTCA